MSSVTCAVIYIKLSKRGVFYGRGCSRIISYRIEHNCNIDEKTNASLELHGWTSFTIKAKDSTVTPANIAELCRRIEQVVGRDYFSRVELSDVMSCANAGERPLPLELEKILDDEEKAMRTLPIVVEEKKDGPLEEESAWWEEEEDMTTEKSYGGHLKEENQVLRKKIVALEESLKLAHEQSGKQKDKYQATKSENKKLKEQLAIEDKEINKLKEALDIFMR